MDGWMDGWMDEGAVQRVVGVQDGEYKCPGSFSATVNTEAIYYILLYQNYRKIPCE